MEDVDRRQVVLESFNIGGAVLGAPGDEARSGHRLWNRGLDRCFWSAEVFNSDWIRRMERVDSVHPHHDPSRFLRFRHYILNTKEATFEVVADWCSVRRVEGTTPEVAKGLL